MKKALVCGVGRMGQCIVYAMDRLGYEVIGVDSWEGAAENVDPDKFIHTPELEDIKKAINHHSPDVVVSSLPYHQLKDVAFYCIDKGIRYCDLGGRVDVSADINKYAEEKASKPVFTDLGLAPGLVNILAEWGYSELHHKVHEVKIMVGGVPAMPTNPPLNYAVTWSVDGLINEYRDDCEVLKAGEIHKVAGMEGKEDVSFELLKNEKLEAFYTSGGASHTIRTMKDRGVKNCSYKTIRYEGHRDVVKFLIRNCDLDDKTLESIFLNGCPKDHDVVLIKATVKGGNVTWNREVIIGYDLKFSAMQKSTAYSISAAAALMADGCFDNRVVENRSGDIKLPLVLHYKDIPFDLFKDNLEKLGVTI